MSRLCQEKELGFDEKSGLALDVCQGFFWELP
jgi:hypothetical protein